MRSRSAVTAIVASSSRASRSSLLPRTSANTAMIPRPRAPAANTSSQPISLPSAQAKPSAARAVSSVTGAPYGGRVSIPTATTTNATV
jgi:hypothetical protein